MSLKLVVNNKNVPQSDSGPQIGDLFEIDGIDEITREKVTFRVRVREVGWYKSSIKAGMLFRGAMVQVEGGTALREPFPVTCLRRILPSH